MGQRLEVCITDNKTELANAYYHWSAYTNSSFEIATEIVTAINCRKVRGKDKIKKAIRLLEVTGAGVTKEEKDFLKLGTRFKNFRFKKCNGRNFGLIAVTPDGMKETRKWQEGQVFIDIEGKMVKFDVWCRYTKKELKEYYPDEKIEPEKLETAPDFWMSFEDFLDFANNYEDGKWYKYGNTYYVGIY